MYGYGSPGHTLTDEDLAAILGDALGALPPGERVLLIVPDGTRTAPMPRLLRHIHAALAPRAAQIDILIALGTHQPMSQPQIDAHLGVAPGEWDAAYPGVRVFNHRWDLPETFVTLGAISADEIAEISRGMLRRSVDVRVNRMALAYDRILICGPVFPHEVVGFSGGNKYLFPGISGPEVINLSHWLGALITSYAIIGVPGLTPVRQVINRAAALIPTPKTCVSVLVRPGGAELAGMFVGAPEESWEAASALSAQLHVRYVERPFQQVLAVMPAMYQDIWTAAKGMYKLEPVVADGGELIIYAPHISAFSYTHGAHLAKIGYHCRDYFVRQWERFQDEPWGVLAHSTHLAGMGTFDPAEGERLRVRVTLATGIPPEACAAHNVGYRDPATVDPAAWAGREEDGVLVVPKAGELLYRLR